MLQLTKRTEYGLIALVHMADREGEFVSVREICDRYPVPKRLLAEVLKDLNRVAILESQRGALGGYALARSADAITLGEIVAALEGAPSLTSCESLGNYVDGECEVESTCPIRSPIHRIRKRIWDLMQRTSLRALAHPEHATALEITGFPPQVT
jgi:Rrf2 family protein